MTVRVTANGGGTVTADLTQTPSIEELFITGQSPSSLSTTTTLEFLRAPFPVRIMQASLTVQTAVAVSDTNYWTIDLVKWANTAPPTALVVASKTTKTTASGGEAFVVRQAWTFDAIAFDAANKLGIVKDVFGLRFTPTGSPTALALPGWTLRYEPS